MAEKIVAKFYVTTVEKQGYPSEGKPHTTGVKVNLQPVYAPDDKGHENHRFWQATPQGQLWMQINNPAAFEFFSAGEEVYLTFTKPEAE